MKIQHGNSNLALQDTDSGKNSDPGISSYALMSFKTPWLWDHFRFVGKIQTPQCLAPVEYGFIGKSISERASEREKERERDLLSNFKDSEAFLGLNPRQALGMSVVGELAKGDFYKLDVGMRF